MKKQLINISQILLIITLLVSCKDPNPVELIQDDTSLSDDLEIELLSPEPDQLVYSNYDSTGITQTIPEHATVINISDIKNTLVTENDIITIEDTYFGFTVYDFNEPILNSLGDIIGYRARALGNAFFNNDTALIVPHIIRYREAGVIKNINAGFKHILRLRRRLGNGNGNRVNFRFRPFIGQPVNFDVDTPPELTGNIKVTGNPGNNNFGVELRWNSTNGPKVEIILAGVPIDGSEIFPIYRLRTKDDGFLRIPGNLIRNIPFDRFDSLVFTFVRRFTKKYSGSNLSDNYIVAHSIHNIRIKID